MSEHDNNWPPDPALKAGLTETMDAAPLVTAAGARQEVAGTLGHVAEPRVLSALASHGRDDTPAVTVQAGLATATSSVTGPGEDED